ncbi:hypothetical protein T492DRAFT_1022093 [Pavlovales sp. CCMP2436]|nr:hypothetical protein T492DRAFT_1022093 [Pavlovales sp. CCMP2436]
MQGAEDGASSAGGADVALLAFATGLHPRLGSKSPVQMLTPDLASRIALLHHLQTTRWVVAISMRTGWLVDCISFHYSDGTSTSSGGHGGQERPLFKLSPGEFITRIRIRQGDHLDAVQWETSFGRLSVSYGGSGGKPREITAGPGTQIFGVTGAQPARGTFLTSIQPVLRPAPHPSWAEDIEYLRLHGFAAQRSFICRPSRAAHGGAQASGSDWD